MKQNKQKVKCLVIYTTDCDGVISQLNDNESIKKLSVYSHNPIRFETNRARKEYEKKEKELEASIRKEVCMELTKDLQHDTYCTARGERFKECALCYIERKLSKGIEIK